MFQNKEDKVETVYIVRPPPPPPPASLHHHVNKDQVIWQGQ
jgi:hypothetical protein